MAKTQLERELSGLDGQFVKASSDLEKLSRYGDQFVEQVEKLIGLATGQSFENTIFDKAIQLIEQAAGFLAGCQAETGRVLELLQNHSAQIERLLGADAELQRAMLPLSIVQTLFRMESVALGVEVQQMFAALTQQIESLHSQMREIFGTKFRQLEQTRQTIDSVITQLGRQLSQLQQVTSTHQARIESSLENLKMEMSSNQSRDVQLGRLSRELSHEVNQIVTGLQFQDIVNQKLQHVLAALPQITERFARLRTTSNAAALEAAQFLRQSCRLESEQVESARKELAAAETAIQAGVEKVLAHLNEADAQCLSLEEFKLLTTSFDGIVQVLVETIEDVRKLVSHAVANAAEAYDLLRPLGGLASDLTTVIRGMSAQIHLIGLNAQVQAAQAANASAGRQGASLEVLSARTSEITRETNRISEQAAIQLDALVAGLAGSVQAFEELHARGRQQQERLDRQGRLQEEQLHAFRDRALELLRDIGGSLDNIHQQAEQTRTTVQFASFHQVTLPALHRPLFEIGEAAERWLAAKGRRSTAASLVDGFKGNYTMESERAVFEQVLATGQPTPAAASVSKPAGPPAAELFLEPSTLPDKEIPRPAANQPSPPVVSVAVAPAKEALGNNVELF